jgi:hypothetical protein
MKTKLNLLIIALTIASLYLFNSCSKDVEVGPAGATGATGATGASGNANVKSFNITINNNDWDKATGLGFIWIYTYDFPALTKSIMDSGMIIVYLKTTNGSSYSIDPLPLDNYLLMDASGGTSTFTNISSNPTFDTSTGKGKLLFVLNSSTVITSQNPITYRVVLATSHMRLANPNLNWNKYTEVKKAFNLND